MISAPITALQGMTAPMPVKEVKDPTQTGDFRKAFDSVTELVAPAEGSKTMNRTEGTGASGKDSGQNLTQDRGAQDNVRKDYSGQEQYTDKTAEAPAEEIVAEDGMTAAERETATKVAATDTDTTEGTEVVTETETETIEEDPVVKEVLSSYAMQLFVNVAEILNIQPEELTEYMQKLEIDLNDLTVPATMNELVATVMGDGDILSLVTDSNLSDTAGLLNSMTKELMTELTEQLPEMEPEEVTTAFETQLANIELSPEPEEVSTEKIPLTELLESWKGRQEADVGEKTEIRTDSFVEEKEVVQAGDMVVEHVTAQTENQELASGDNGADKENSQTAGDEAADALGIDAAKQRAARREEHFAPLDENATANPYVNVNMDSMEVREALRAEAPMEYTANTAEIMDQIVTHMRSQVKEDTTTLDMMLHPASLGNVALTLASRDGNVTAHFTAQNESVRAALESQIIILKENLEMQGVKVEAVEVTVSSHAFEENLEQGNDRNDAEAEEQEKLRRATRKIDLGLNAEGEAEELDTADQLTVEMMQADGRRMDYKV